MDVYIDGAVMPAAQESDSVIGDVVERFRGRLAANRRLLVGIRCDDRDAAGADIEPLLAEPLARFQRVEFTTASADDLAADLLEQISGLLAETRPVQSEVVELLAQGATARAMELLAGCLPIWSQSSSRSSSTSLRREPVAVASEDRPRIRSRVSLARLPVRNCARKYCPRCSPSRAHRNRPTLSAWA